MATFTDIWRFFTGHTWTKVHKISSISGGHRPREPEGALQRAEGSKVDRFESRFFRARRRTGADNEDEAPRRAAEICPEHREVLHLKCLHKRTQWPIFLACDDRNLRL